MCHARLLQDVVEAGRGRQNSRSYSPHNCLWASPQIPSLWRSCGTDFWPTSIPSIVIFWLRLSTICTCYLCLVTNFDRLCIEKQSWNYFNWCWIGCDFIWQHIIRPGILHSDKALFSWSFWSFVDVSKSEWLGTLRRGWRDPVAGRTPMALKL